MTPADLFAQSLTQEVNRKHKRVNAIDAALARQAIDLHIATGGDLRELLEPYGWYYYPHVLLSLAFSGDQLMHSLRQHACWCARSAMPPASDVSADAQWLRETVSMIEDALSGKPNRLELKAKVKTGDPITGSAAGAVRKAAWSIDIVTFAPLQSCVRQTAKAVRFNRSRAGFVWEDVCRRQSLRLIQVVCAALEG